jgi:hypothetical protein
VLVTVTVTYLLDNISIGSVGCSQRCLLDVVSHGGSLVFRLVLSLVLRLVFGLVVRHVFGLGGHGDRCRALRAAFPGIPWGCSSDGGKSGDDDGLHVD